MDRLDFTQGVVRTRVLEKRLLSAETVERLIEAKNMEDIIKTLRETTYASSLSDLSKQKDFERILAEELQNTYRMMAELSPDSTVVDLLALKYDYHNVKVLLKEIILEKDLSHLYLPIGTLDIGKIKASILKENLQEVDPTIRAAIMEVLADYKITRDPQRIGIILDRLYIRQFVKMVKETRIPLFFDYAAAMIDFLNIRTILRLKRQGKDTKFFEEVFLPGGDIEKEKLQSSIKEPIDTMIRLFRHEKIADGLLPALESYRETDHLTDFEKAMDDNLMKRVRSSKYVHFGPEPIFAYLLAKETEIKNLRIILISKLNEIPPVAVRKRVRDCYV